MKEEKAAKEAAPKITKKKMINFPMGKYFNTLSLSLLILGILIGLGISLLFSNSLNKEQVVIEKKDSYWFILHRKSNIEYLYRGEFGSKNKSTLIKAFHVKVGVPGERPTPLPKLSGREYWKVVKKFEASDNPEIAPYFIELDVPGVDMEPYGPVPYNECNGQCNWILPGAFGLHGVNGDNSRLDSTNIGSSGCIRHTDDDITYLFNILEPEKEEIRYYIEDL